MHEPPTSTLPWPRWAEVAAVVGVWGLFTAVAIIARALTGPVPFSAHTVQISVAEYAPWLLATPAVLWLVRWVPPFGSDWARGLAIHAAAAVAIVLAVGAVQAVGVNALGPPPGLRDRTERSATPDATSGPDRADQATTDARRQGTRRRGSNRRGPWAPSLGVLIYLMLLGVGVARTVAIESAGRRSDAERAAAERDHARAEAERLVAQVAEAHLAALRMQLRPHFLFNALNAVSALAGDDPAEVRRIVARLSSMLRRVLDADARPLIGLGEELAFARDYLDLQRVRFERLAVEEDVDGSVLDAEVPTLVLQPSSRTPSNTARRAAAGPSGWAPGARGTGSSSRSATTGRGWRWGTPRP